MRKVPLVKLLVFNEENGGKTAQIFTEYPLENQVIDLDQPPPPISPWAKRTKQARREGGPAPPFPFWAGLDAHPLTPSLCTVVPPQGLGEADRLLNETRINQRLIIRGFSISLFHISLYVDSCWLIIRHPHRHWIGHYATWYTEHSKSHIIHYMPTRPTKMNNSKKCDASYN